MVSNVTYSCFVCFKFFSKDEMYNYALHYPGMYEGICQKCFETGRFKKLLKKGRAGKSVTGGVDKCQIHISL